MERMKNMLLGVMVVLTLVAPAGYALATIYSAGSLLQTGDVKTEHILNGTITNNDISNTAKISATKVSPNGTTGTILLTDGTNIATTTALEYATTTGDLYVFGGKVHASSTNLNGVNYSWPSADGSSSQILQTDGGGTLSWVSGASQKLSYTFTSGEAITQGDIVALGDGSGTSAASNAATGTTGSNGNVTNTTWQAMATTTPASGVAQVTAVIGCFRSANPPETRTITMTVMADSAGHPSGVSLGSVSDSWSIANGGANHTFTLSSPIDLSGSTTYWFVFKDSASGGSVRYCPNSTAPISQQQSSDSGSSWGSSGSTGSLGATYVTAASNRVYKASAASNNYLANAIIGMAQTTVSQGQSITVDIGGLSAATSTAAAATTYYLGNTPGKIQTTAGTVSRKVGLGLGALGFLVRIDNP